jgi:hypothetical protein
MTNKPPPSNKWHEIKQQSEDLTQAPVNTAARIKKLYLDTELGSPVDTEEENDAQRANLGPKDTRTEDTENPSNNSGPRP